MKTLPKRLLIQIFAFLAHNPFLGRFFTGRIYSGPLKGICAPGLNCYSCPAAAASCPIGSLQFFFTGGTARISLLVTGFLVTVGAAFGRFICGFVCPFGFLQDLLYKIKTPKIKARLKRLAYLKYLVLIVFVIALPMAVRDEWGNGAPWFCQYICPSGTIFGALPMLAINDFLTIGGTFAVKISLAGTAVLSSVFFNRPFCRTLCPLGAIYSLFNKFSFFRINLDSSKCQSCGHCAKACKICLEPVKEINSPECLRCGGCVRACPSKAMSYGVLKRR